METDISKLHEGTDGFYYDDFLAPDKAETFVGQLVSTQWWQKGGRFALICNFLAEDGRKIALFAFQKYTGFYGPGDGAVNFKHAEMNTFWECEIRENPEGTLYLDERPATWRAENRRHMIETDRYTMDCLEGMKRYAGRQRRCDNRRPALRSAEPPEPVRAVGPSDPARATVGTIQ